MPCVFSCSKVFVHKIVLFYFCASLLSGWLSSRVSFVRTINLHTLNIHCVSEKTCDYIFYNNLNNKCPVTIIYNQSAYTTSKYGFISHLTYLSSATVYLGKLQNTKNDKFSRKQHILLWSNNVKQYLFTHKFFDTLELEIAMNYSVHSRSVNASFAWDLTNRSVRFGLSS